MIVSIGRLEDYKGHHRVIQALPIVRRTRPDMRVRLVGSGPAESALRKLADELGVRDAVDIGPVEADQRGQLAELLLRSAVVVALSEYESQGLGAYEALALGRPLLVNDGSALSELADRPNVRMVASAASPATVAATLLALVDAPSAPPTALPNWDDCVAMLIHVYDEVISSRGQTDELTDLCRYDAGLTLELHEIDIGRSRRPRRVGQRPCDLRPAADARPAVHPTLADDRLEHNSAVAERAQIAHAGHSAGLEARNLGDAQPLLASADVHERLDLESFVRSIERREHVAPEGHVAVAEVGVARTERRVDDPAKHVIPEPAMQLHVARTAADGEPRAECDVGPGDQRTDERRQLARIHRAVAVERNDDVAASPPRNRRAARSPCPVA